MRATQFVLFYGEEVQVDVLGKGMYPKYPTQVLRREALGAASGYGTVSEPTVMVITRVIPVCLLVKECKAIYNCKGGNLGKVVAREDRQRILTEWKFSWQNEARGSWTMQLIGNFDPWLNQKR